MPLGMEITSHLKRLVITFVVKRARIRHCELVNVIMWLNNVEIAANILIVLYCMCVVQKDAVTVILGNTVQ